MIPHEYDALLAYYGGGLPLEFLRALAWNESRMNPQSVSETGATGIMQIVQSVRKGFNDANGASFTRADLLRADVNIAMGAWLLNRIVRAWTAKHPSLQPDFASPRYVALLVLGYNAGWSEAAGVGRVVGGLEREGWPSETITVQAIHENAARLGGVAKLSRPDVPRYALAVAADVFGPPGAGSAHYAAVSRRIGGTLLGLGALAAAMAILPRKRPSGKLLLGAWLTPGMFPPGPFG